MKREKKQLNARSHSRVSSIGKLVNCGNIVPARRLPVAVGMHANDSEICKLVLQLHIAQMQEDQKQTHTHKICLLKLNHV